MEFSDKINLALDTPLGSFLMVISTSFASLLVIYLFLSIRQKQHDTFVFHNLQAIKELKKLHSAFLFSEHGTNTPFGRLIPITHKTNKNRLQCLFFNPQLFNKNAQKKLQNYLLLTDSSSFEHVMTYEDLSFQPFSVIVKGAWAQKKLTSCHELLMDRNLSAIQSQHLLLELASFLSKLHKTKDNQGKSLFHGFLCPLTLMINLSPNDSINTFKFSFPGIAYALGKDGQTLISQYKKKPPKVPNSFEKQLLNQLDFFAPEYFLDSLQKDTGAHSDVYSFAKLAQYLFSSSCNSFKNIPESWLPFIKQCLDPISDNRPRDLLELQDLLEASEIIQPPLSQIPQIPVALQEEEEEEEEESLGNLIDQLQQQSKITQEDTLLKKGITLIKQKKWNQGKKELLPLLKKIPKNATLLTYLAICHHELKEISKAEGFYLQAKKQDPKIAQTFRKHTAYQI
jgi:tetratricopeptide (TPR) repeat protein